MKLKLSYLLVAAVISTAAMVQAQDKKPDRPSREEMREKFKNMTPEEREKQIKEWREKQGGAAPEGDRRREGGFQEAAKHLGVSPEEFRNLTPDERRAKMNEAADKKVAELKKKEKDGSITEDEKKLLQRLEARKKAEQGDGARRDGPPAGRPSAKGPEKTPGKK